MFVSQLGKSPRKQLIIQWENLSQERSEKNNKFKKTQLKQKRIKKGQRDTALLFLTPGWRLAIQPNVKVTPVGLISQPNEISKGEHTTSRVRTTRSHSDKRDAPFLDAARSLSPLLAVC